VKKDCVVVVEAENYETLAKMSRDKRRRDGMDSKMYDLFSRKRDQGVDNSFRVITSKDLVITNGDQSSHQYNIDLKPGVLAAAFLRKFIFDTS
jgi:hypothetical protein